MPTIRNIETTTSGIIKEMTDTPPLSFNSIGEPLIDWSISGANGGVGDKTAQLIPYPYYSPDGEYSGVWFTTTGNRIVASGTTTSGLLFYLWRIDHFPTGTYTITVRGNHSGANVYVRDNTNSQTIVSLLGGVSGDKTETFTIDNDISVFVYINTGANSTLNFDCTIMLNTGSTALPYEPYGYKIPVICNENTTNIYIDAPLGLSDSVSIADTGISIPTVNGSNTLSVETAVQPSEVYIKYKEGGDEMVTLAKIGGRYNTALLEIRGLSTDTKPTTEIEGMVVTNGSTYIEIDTGDTYMFDAANGVWHNTTG